MARDTRTAVVDLCLAFPESETFLSHGVPNFRVGGKSFASFLINHHGDGRVALWLAAPPGLQQLQVQVAPEHFFVPPYVGPRGWLGVCLDRGLDWATVCDLVAQAYRHVAPARLLKALPARTDVPAPSRTTRVEEIDPLRSARGQQLLLRMRDICLGLPEVREEQALGGLAWTAGKKRFAALWSSDVGGRSCLELGMCCGAEQQALHSGDPRFRIPPYIGHYGWIALNASTQCDWQEVAVLVRDSYRRVALKRMLAAMDKA